MRSFYFLVFLILWGCKHEQKIYLDSIQQGTIINDFGIPRANQSFGKNALTINHKRFSHGLGTHASSILCINVNKKALRFRANIGIDSEINLLANPDSMKYAVYFPHYVYGLYGDKNFDGQNFKQGGTARFEIYLDDSLIFNSKVMTLTDPALSVDVDISGGNVLKLVTTDAGDGCNIDHTDWADAQLIMQDDAKKEDLSIYYYPKHISINQLGYLPDASKQCAISGFNSDSFSVINAATSKNIFSSQLIIDTGDFGTFMLGDFSALKEKGKYYIRSKDFVSDTFEISPDVYRPAIMSILSYLKKQRCGSPYGWHGACHLDDGKDSKTGTHIDLTGGWHDACDIRKMSIDLCYFEALSHMGMLTKDMQLKKQLLDEIKWGNKFYQHMQMPEGYFMQQFDIANYFSDNKIGTDDDLKANTEPEGVSMQLKFILAQSLCAKYSSTLDKAYAKQCLQSAERCYKWTMKNQKPLNVLGYAYLASSTNELYKLTGNIDYKNSSFHAFDEMLALQKNENSDGVSDFFLTSQTDREPFREIFWGNWTLITMTNFLNDYPQSENYNQWKNSLAKYCNNYLKAISKKNSFSLLPIGLYTTDPGGGRRTGQYFYRWFWDNNDSTAIWWNGINPHILSMCVGLNKASKILNDPELMRLAQRQVDWVFGFNPFNASTFTGLGKHQPPLFKTGQFTPVTPDINGGGMAGIGGTHEDVPALYPGWWNTCEYWGPVDTYALWALAELMYNR